jgi:hypothetical protein
LNVAALMSPLQEAANEGHHASDPGPAELAFFESIAVMRQLFFSHTPPVNVLVSQRVEER